MPLLGGVIGAVVVIIAIFVAALFLVGRRKRRQEHKPSRRRCSSLISTSGDVNSAGASSDPDVVQYQRKSPSREGVVDVLSHSTTSGSSQKISFNKGIKASITSSNVS